MFESIYIASAIIAAIGFITDDEAKPLPAVIVGSMVPYINSIVALVVLGVWVYRFIKR